MADRSIFNRYSKRWFPVLFALALVLNSFAQNPIVTENALPGNPISEWGVPDFRDNRIAGFSTRMSLNSGETVRFKINVQSGATYTLKIYRIGYYGGNGARLKQNLGTLSGTTQAACLTDPVTGMTDCSNWSESASWNIPSTAVSGFYIAKLERTGGGSNHIAFIVRNDASHSDLYLQFPDATWQAYNGYGGNSLYDGNTGFPNGHAVKVSYNRPFFPYNSLFNTDGREADWYMNAAYPMIRWLEHNGYDVTYTGCNDVDNNGSRLLNHKVFISVGHDEYWSKEQRQNVEAARNAGVHLAFFSGNEVYWKTRWESNNGSEDRTLVCYKEGVWADGTLAERTCGFKCDNSSAEWTGLWRTGADYDAGQAENALSGQISWLEFPSEIGVPSHYKKLRFWRNTSIPNLPTGQTAFLGAHTLGYEWDYEQPQYAGNYPAGRITMSSRTVNNVTHKLSLYRHSSGALVFGAGTVQWAWGLDGGHWGGTSVVSPEMQQATVNLFADMGVQPGTIQTGIIPATKSTDVTPPVSAILSPVNGSSKPAGLAITISGTASDAGGGVVAGVEISTDGGVTWRQADITAADAIITWNYIWIPNIEGTSVIKTRAFDDNGNKENPGAGINVIVLPAVCPCTIFPASSVPAKPLNNDALGGIELGVKFRSTQNGFITGIRYYKGAGATGTRIGSLWSNTGTRLATATFTAETASGWQQVLFTAPVAITAGITYVASYHSSSGDYAVTNPFFTQAVVNSSLRALANGEDGPNGLSLNTATPAFPTNGFQTSNYWVDVVFTRSTVSTAPVVTTQPSAQTVCAGKNVTFNSAASGSPAPTVQWQSSIQGTSWINIPGATNSSLNFVATTADNNKQYRAAWNNSKGTVNSNAVTLTVNAIPPAPLVSVNNFCGYSIMTAASFSGTLLWNNGATTSFIKVITTGTHAVTQTVRGCTSPVSTPITALPKPIPVLSSILKVTVNSGAIFTYIPKSTVLGTVFTWSRSAVAGISNPAETGNGNIAGFLINKTSSPINVTYVYTLTAPGGCTNKQNLVITVNPSSVPSCVISTSIISDFNSAQIPAGRYIWFNSSLNPRSFGKFKQKAPLTIYVTNSRINFTANGRQYTLTVPDSRIRFDAAVRTASTRFINNIWETAVPLGFNKDIFMGGLSYLLPSSLPGNIRNVKWSADINIDKDVSLTWRWAATVYTNFAANAGILVKPISSKKDNPYPNSDEAGAPQNFKQFVVEGATGKGKNDKDYNGKFSPKKTIGCPGGGHGHDDDDDDDDDEDDDKPSGITNRTPIRQLPELSVKQLLNEKFNVVVMPNPGSTVFDMTIRSVNLNPVSVRIFDISGLVLEQYDKIIPNTVLRFGQKWKSGTYFAEVIQGDQRKIVKIIKVN